MVLALLLLPLSSLIGGLLYATWWLVPYRPVWRAQAVGAAPLADQMEASRRLRAGSVFLLLALLVGGLASAFPLWHVAGWLSRYLLPALLVWGSYRALQSGRLSVSDLLWGLLGGSLLLAGVGLGAYFADWSLHPQWLCLSGFGQPCLIDLLLLPETRARSF